VVGSQAFAEVEGKNESIAGAFPAAQTGSKGDDPKRHWL